MPRSSRKRTTPVGSDDKRVTVRTDIDPAKVLDPTSEAAITAELAKINELKKTGAPKPKNVSWGDWMGPKKMSPRHYVIANLVAMGMRGSEICAETGLTPTQVSHLMNNTLIKAYANKLQAYYTRDAKKRFENLIPKAVGIFEEVLAPHSQEQTKLKIDVATKVMDRSWGRAQGEVTDSGGTVLGLLRALKDLNNSAHADPVDRAIPVYSSVDGSEATVGEADSSPSPEDEGAPAPFSGKSADDGSISGLLDTWENGDNDGSGKEEDEEKGDS